MKRVVLAVLLTIAVTGLHAQQQCGGSGCNPPTSPLITVPNTPTGTVTMANGSYFQWQYQFGPKTMFVAIENGIKVPGLYQFAINLPSTYTITGMHATADYAPWCWSQGTIWHVDAINGTNLDFLVGDKFLVIPSSLSSPPPTTHVSYQGVYPGGVPTSTLLFNYYTDESCSFVTNSMVLFFNI